jgi:hypothetical protein
MLERLERVDLKGQTAVIFENTAEQIIRLNHRQLYIEGVDAHARTLAPYKWKEYAKYKARKNPAHPGIPDLYDEGNFYKGFEILQVGDGGITTLSKDDKAKELVNKYGDVHGLTPDNEAEYVNNVFAPALFNYIENVTGLKAT